MQLNGAGPGLIPGSGKIYPRRDAYRGELCCECASQICTYVARVTKFMHKVTEQISINKSRDYRFMQSRGKNSTSETKVQKGNGT